MAKMKAPTIAELDDTELTKQRGELAIALEEADGTDRTRIDGELRAVEDEISGRRVAVERAQVARVAREQREHDEALAVREAEKQRALGEYERHAVDRADAAGAIDAAVEALSGAIRNWNAAREAQEVDCGAAGVSSHEVRRDNELNAWLSHNLELLFRNGGAFRRWGHDDAKRTFAEVDAPFGPQAGQLTTEEETTR